MRIGFGGGCHWCTEAVFQSLRGVEKVEQGFIRSTPPHDAWSEAVIVHFDAAEIDLDTLIEVHVRTHSATTRHGMREKYRSAVYGFDDEQAGAARRILDGLQAGFDQPLVTRVLPYCGFRASEARFRDYYRSDPQRPFCQRFIDPKLELIRREYTDQAGEWQPSGHRSS
jgi:peptide-methionine (S)-S-oxide reductase